VGPPGFEPGTNTL